MPKKILVVEDDPDVRDILRHFLEEAGYTVITAGSGEEALRQIEHETPDLITLDPRIPSPDGWGIAYQLKSNPATSRISVIMLAEHTRDQEERLRAYSMGVDHYFTKPFEPAEFLDCVRMLLNP